MLLIISGSFASISVLKPVKAEVFQENTIELGKIACGETLEIIVKRRTSDFYWDRIVEDESSIPSGWNLAWETQRDSIIARISVPENAVESTQRIKLAFSSEQDEFALDFLNVSVVVKKNLLSADMMPLSQETMVEKETVFKLLISNNSLAEHSLLVSSDLPGYWFRDRTISVAPGETRVFELAVVPKSYGLRDFRFSLNSRLNSFSDSFDARLLVFQTVSGKFTSALYGFPFFSVSLAPFYFIDAFLALVS